MFNSQNIEDGNETNNNSNKRVTTVLSYSDKKNLMDPSPTLTTTTLLHKEESNQIDPTDDYYTSNQLNEIVMSKSVELHYFVFHNDIEGVKKYILKHKKLKHNLSDYLSIRDVHGNTPLHLAAMLGHIEIASLLTKYGAVVKARNKQMWTPLDEAISYGNRDLIKCILKKFEQEIDSIVDSSKPKINMALKEMFDFYVEIKWDFESWIPLVSRFLPSDVCKLYKKGAKLRVDCTLGDLARNAASSSNSTPGNSDGPSGISAASVVNWQRGDLTFIFDIEKIGEKSSILYLDNKRKTFSYIIEKDEPANVAGAEVIKDLDKEIDILLSRETIHVKLNTKQATFLPTQVGWFLKKDKIEQMNGYLCQFYDVNNLYIVSKLRSEHLSEEEIRKNEENQKKMRQKLLKNSPSSGSIKSGNKSNSSTSLSKINNENDEKDELNRQLDEMDDIKLNFDVEFRPNLPPPEKTNISWYEYVNSTEGNWPCLGRKHRSKESKKEFKAQLAMSQEFPLTLNDLNKLLDALAPLAKFRKLKEFLNQRLPPGFPVKIDIPIVPTVSAKVSFQNFRHETDLRDDLFKVPDSYTEENIFEKLSNKSNSEASFSNNNTNTSTTKNNDTDDLATKL